MEWKRYLDGIPHATSEQIKAMEAKMRIKLPQKYVNDLSTHAGDIPLNNIATFDNEEYLFGPLLYVGGKEDDKYYSYSIESVIERIIEWADVEQDFVADFWPFSKDLSTGYYCFDNRAEPAATIVFLNKQYDPDEDGAIIPLAQSYEEFMASLT